jgi:hypothetical protein
MAYTNSTLPGKWRKISADDMHHASLETDKYGPMTYRETGCRSGQHVWQLFECRGGRFERENLEGAWIAVDHKLCCLAVELDTDLGLIPDKFNARVLEWVDGWYSEIRDS